MPTAPSSILAVAHKHFDYLQRDFGFTAADRVGEGWVESAEVRYESPRITVTPYWNSRDGAGITIAAKVDTFWIRPASSHEFDIGELAQFLPPEAPRTAPALGRSEETDTEIEPWFEFHAGQLRTYFESLLRGDLTVCDDMLIMRYCSSTRGWPREAYLKIFREETAALPAEDRQQLEAAIASGSPRCLYFLLDGWVHGGRLRGERFLTTLNDFWLQYLQ